MAVYDELGKHLDKEIIATEILPQLWRMSFGPLLNLEQVIYMIWIKKKLQKNFGQDNIIGQYINVCI